MLLQEKMRQIKLAPAERSLIDYLLANPTAMADQTIKELSEKTYVHPSTFIRIAKKLGFNGWLDLKTAFVEEQTYMSSHFNDVDANFPFSSHDGIMTIAKKLAKLEQTTIEDTLSLIHHDELQSETIVAQCQPYQDFRQQCQHLDFSRLCFEDAAFRKKHPRLRYLRRKCL